MAITFIYKITSTGNLALNYSGENKEGVILEKKNEEIEYQDKRGNCYILKQDYLDKMKSYISINQTGEIHFKTISTAMNCSIKSAYDEWELVRKMKNPSKGNTGILQYCIVQNFGTDVDPKLANAIGMEFARTYLSDYQVVVSTHINTGCVHNHIEFNATSFITGKKFYDQLKTIDEIRKVSDAICEKYELEVLESTRNFQYIKYKDDMGRTKFFEPTERKRDIKEGYYSNKNDYRNQSQYKGTSKQQESHIDVLKADIEESIQKVKRYEELLDVLRNKGYIISDKTSKGEWRKHIIFKKITWGKGVRDSSLGERYEREILTKRILEKKHNEKIKSTYRNVYTKEDIDELNLQYRFIRINGKKEKISRSKLEKEIIGNIRAKSAIYERGYDISKTENRIVREPHNEARKKYLVERIGRNLRTLFFVEEKNITSFEQMESILIELKSKKSYCESQIILIENVLNKATLQFSQLTESELEERIKQKEDYVKKCEIIKGKLNEISLLLEQYTTCYETLKEFHSFDNKLEYRNPFEFEEKRQDETERE